MLVSKDKLLNYEFFDKKWIVPESDVTYQLCVDPFFKKNSEEINKKYDLSGLFYCEWNYMYNKHSGLFWIKIYFLNISLSKINITEQILMQIQKNHPLFCNFLCTRALIRDNTVLYQQALHVILYFLKIEHVNTL